MRTLALALLAALACLAQIPAAHAQSEEAGRVGMSNGTA